MSGSSIAVTGEGHADKVYAHAGQTGFSHGELATEVAGQARRL